MNTPKKPEIRPPDKSKPEIKPPLPAKAPVKKPVTVPLEPSVEEPIEPYKIPEEKSLKNNV